jgi:hypothetical protein
MPQITSITTAPFLAAHLGELTRIVPPHLVDEVLTISRKVQRRVRLLPSRTMVYYLLAATLFPEWGYTGVWSELVAGLGPAAGDPSASALRQGRRRIGAAPLRLLLQRLCGTISDESTPGARWRGLTVLAWDGTTLAVPDTPANAGFFGRGANDKGAGAYPLARVSALVECGTRSVVHAVCGPLADDEISQATRMLPALRADTVLLGDRNYDGYELLHQVRATGAYLLFRAKGQRNLPVVTPLPDGSWISFIPQPGPPAWACKNWRKHGGTPPPVPGMTIRVVVATITLTDTTGATRDSTIRLLTTLTDHQAHPARELAALYHERWEIETAFHGLKVTLRGPDRVLRSGTPGDVDQEIHAYLITYQATRIALCRAADRIGLDPDRLSFTIAIRAARQSVVNADDPTRTADRSCRPPARIATELTKPRNLLPSQRRPRTSARVVKRPLSLYAYKDKTDRRKRTVTTTMVINAPHQPVLTQPGTT